MLTLNTNNGGISIDDFRGTATFHARNGGLSLTNVGGDLRGETTNGGVSVSVAGDHWDGSGLDVETRNGGITLNVPKGFSAELEAGTTQGRISIDFPVTVSGTFGRHLQTTLGSGGPKVRAITQTAASPSASARVKIGRSGRSEAWYRVRFGSGRSLVRIQSPRPSNPVPSPRAVAKAVNIADLRRLAQRRLPRIVFDYADGGAEDEITLRDNCRVFDTIQLRPRNAVQVPRADLRTTVLGTTFDLPFLLAPIGSTRMFYPHGEALAAPLPARPAPATSSRRSAARRSKK